MTNKEKEKSELRYVYLIYYIIVALALFIVAKILIIQFRDGSELRKKAIHANIKFSTLEANRGNIYSRDGILLATSTPEFDIFVDFSRKTIKDEVFNKSYDSLAYHLHKLFPKDKSHAEYRRLLINARKKEERYYLIKRRVNYKELLELRKFPIFRLGRLEGGFIAEPRIKRVHPNELLAKRTIGYSREKYKVGLEGAYDEILAGKDGKRLVQRVVGGRYIPVNDKFEIPAIQGLDIITTIDIKIQDVAENALLEHLKFHNADHGCVVLMEVKTGEIRAIVNLQKIGDEDYFETNNYAVGKNMEPGSSFKLMSMLVALENNKIDLNNKVETGNGKLKIADITMRDIREGGYGTITFREAFEFSSNIGIAKIIMQIYSSNPGKFTEGLYRMGVQNSLGIEIKGETRPQIKTPKDPTWSRVSLPQMSIGYEVLMTPLQILAFYNAVANNGTMVRPMFVKEIRNAGKTVKKFETVILNKSICSKRTIDTVKSLLEGVVERGTARSLRNTSCKIAGKTATAQVADTAGYIKGLYNASFIGYFPADNPKYSCIVVVNNPRHGLYYGGNVAAPVFKDIAEVVYATELDIHDPIENYDSDKEQFLPEVSKIHYKIAKNEIPDFRGMNLRDATFLAESLGIRIKNVNGKGKVVSQSITSGSSITNKTYVELNLSP